MIVKFWGVRGSVPCPGPNTYKFGGNTTCIELRLKDTNRLIIIDAGSGIRELGSYMMANDIKKGPIDTEIFLSHTHWDHILGFPFFIPIYVKDTKLKIYGPVSYQEKSLESIVSGQLSYHYFPVRNEELASQIEYMELKEQELDLGDGLTVTTKYLNHPVSTLGYRFQYKGKVFCTCFDHEPYRNVFSLDETDPAFIIAAAEEGELVAVEQNKLIAEFVRDADLLVYDAQYTAKEYEAARKGWGHSSIEDAIVLGKVNKVKRMALFHHDPDRTDEQLEDFCELYCKSTSDKDFAVFFAREQMEIEL